MRIGLVGYFGFGNYGDELFVRLYQSAMPGAEFTVLRGCDGVSKQDPVEVAHQDCIIIGGGDLVISSGFSERYWSPVLLHRPVLVVGVGVDSEQGYCPSAVRRMRSFFQHDNVKLIHARDPSSQRWIRQNLQPRIAVDFYPDLVASMAMRRRDSDTPTFGLVLRSQAAQAPANVGQLLDRAVAHGYRTASIVLGTGHTRAEDLAVATTVATDELVLCDDVAGLTRSLAECDIVASQRLHGCIAAMMMGIPTIGLRTVGKFEAWFDQFDSPLPLYSVDDPGLAGALERLPSAIDPATIATIRDQARTGLSRLAAAVATVPQGPRLSQCHYYAAFDAPADRRARWSQLSPRLRADPAAQLDLAQELTWYRTEISRWKGAEYLRTIDAHITSTAELANLPPTTRALIAIPVAGVAENETIYATLSLYAQQDKQSLANTTLLLFVNYPDNQAADPAGPVGATLAEIERARGDFPQLRIAAVVEPFDASLPGRHRGIIGYVGRRMYDLALLAVLQAIRQGQRPTGQDVLLIRNDADACGMSSSYLARMLAAVARYPSTDAFVGGIHWGTRNYLDYPGFGVAMAFKEGIRALTMRRDGYDRLPATNGTNVGVRMSTFAAVGGVGHSSYYGAGGDDVEIGSRINEARRRDGGGDRAIRYVTGCAVDATGERPLAIYRTGRSVIHTWSTFNDGAAGYTRRRDAGGEPPIFSAPEDPATSIRRIEQAITDLVNYWYNDRKLAESALRLMVGSHTESGEAVYQAQWHNGHFAFEFTESGRDWVERRLEHYGQRLSNRLYGATEAASRQMVEPLS